MTLKGYIVGTKGDTGRGIASIVENADYTITINLTDGTSYTTAPIAGFTAVEFDENYDLVVTKTDGTQITVETDLDSYRSLLEGYKSDAETAESHASGYATSASGSASTATTQATLARSYAKGDTSSRTGEATDNADYYRGLSASSASSSASSASNSETQALKSEGYAVGKQNGTDVTSDSAYYHNNAKYYAEEASTSATNASASESTATAAAGVLTNCSATATTLAAGSNATASYSNGVFSFGVPKGADGSLASGVLASTYSSSATYAVGDYVYYSGDLYRCKTAITTAEAWTAGHWVQVALGDDVDDLKQNISEPTRNLFDGTYSAFTWMRLSNGAVENTATDSRSTFWCAISFKSGNTVIASNVEVIDSTGRKGFVFTPNNSGDRIQIRHSGGTKDLHFHVPFAFTSGKSYAVSFDLDGYNPSVIGGLVISNIQIEEGNEATQYVTHLSAVDYVARDNISNIIEPSDNLFNNQYSSFTNAQLSNGNVVNTETDNRTGFYFTVQLKNNSTNVNVSNTIPISFIGRARITLTANGNGNNIVILHNGSTRNISTTIPFDFTSGKTYTISLDVKGFDVQTVGGLVLGNIQIEEGSKNSPYIPICSAVDYVARDNINTSTPEAKLNVLLMGDSIFGNDGEIALFLDQMCNSCVNGAFGGTRVSARASSDAFYAFDGVNIITALCTQTWTDQDTAASSLSSTYPWITTRLANLKAVDMSSVDLLIMDWGTNDYTAGQTIEAITTAYSAVIDMLQETYPELRILVTTPIWRYWGTEADNENGDTKIYNVSTLKEIVLAIEDFMKNKRISVLNAYQNLPLSYKTALTYFDANDKTHLNTFGNKVYAELLHGKIRSIY